MMNVYIDTQFVKNSSGNCRATLSRPCSIIRSHTASKSNFPDITMKRVERSELLVSNHADKEYWILLELKHCWKLKRWSSYPRSGNRIEFAELASDIFCESRVTQRSHIISQISFFPYIFHHSLLYQSIIVTYIILTYLSMILLCQFELRHEKSAFDWKFSFKT